MRKSKEEGLSLRQRIKIDPEETTCSIVNFIKERLDFFNRNGVVFGLSGGIDSACIAALLSRAIKGQKMLALVMPEKDSGENSVEDAKLIANKFGIPTKEIDLTSQLESFGVYKILPRKIMEKKKIISKVARIGYRMFPKANNPFLGGLLGTNHHWMNKIQAYYRIKHRLRMVNLYYYAEQLNYLVVGTSNKSEDAVGFFVKYGDGSADIMPIAMFYKTQVKALSRYLGVPKSIVEKAPSPDLLPGITDELAMRISYEKLDLILNGIELGMDEAKVARETDTNVKTIRYVKKLMSLSEHMRNLPDKCYIN